MTRTERALALRAIIDAQSTMAAAAIGAELALTPSQMAEVHLTAVGGAPVREAADGEVWTPGLKVVVGSALIYKENIYEVVQSHITQADWAPDITPALWKERRIEFSPWVPPQGAHDAYPLGAKVTHIGRAWESTVDANVWEPGIYGWKEIVNHG